MHFKADVPKSRALALNYCSVSDPDGSISTAGGDPPGECRVSGSGTREVLFGLEGVGLAVSDAGIGDADRGGEDLCARAGGGTPP